MVKFAFSKTRNDVSTDNLLKHPEAVYNGKDSMDEERLDQ